MGTVRVALIGDVGGHADELSAELAALGVDANGRLPHDLVVIQVGDLIHRGPDSAGVVALVDHFLTTQPGQWIQLVGNHETHYLRPPMFRWDEQLDHQTVATVRRWWLGYQAHVAVSVRTATESYLVTHAGVTRPFWRRVLRSATDTAHAAELINIFARVDGDKIHRAGSMLNAGAPNLSAGPIWADTATELVPSWTGYRLPFSQVHGHTTMVDWRIAHPDTHPNTTDTTYDFDAKHEVIGFDGGRIVGIDPGHRSDATRPWRSLVLPFCEWPQVRAGGIYAESV
ncbi:metallophosphoesterase [Gordonia sp. CPCC 205515]|uniref:metallophosphoesterase n=1 Tax=Gordonia sp. CPCC 205515 TaxID=3140791 RepID=UPI003AF37629